MPTRGGDEFGQAAPKPHGEAGSAVPTGGSAFTDVVVDLLSVLRIF